MRLPGEEIKRKLLHLAALLMPISIFYAQKWQWPGALVPLTLFSLFGLSVIVELVRFKVPAVQRLILSTFGSMMRKEEHFKISGSTWVIGAAFLCCILFWAHPNISFVVLSLFILGDACAALVGISLGRIKIGKKSLEGSLACLGVCLLLFYVAFPMVPGLLHGANLPHILIWIVSLVITVFELVPLKISPSLVINDNIAVPVIAGYTMLLIEKML